MPVLQRVSVSVKTILFATDFSSVSDKASAYAQALALNYRSRVEIAHVFDPSRTTSYVEAILGTPPKERRQLSQESLNRLKQDFLAKGIEAHISMPEGHRPQNSILRLANLYDADMIVAGTHAKWGLERFVLGSTSEELIRNATCPVLTVGPHARLPQEGPLVFRNIVFATDFSPHAAKAAIFALSFAQDSGAHVYFCHTASQEATPEEAKTQDVLFKAALEKMIPETVYEWCTPQTVIRHGDPAECILDFADRVEADLIVLGARNASFWLTHVEHGLTPDLLAEATCPVMTVC